MQHRYEANPVKPDDGARSDHDSTLLKARDKANAVSATIEEDTAVSVMMDARPVAAEAPEEWLIYLPVVSSGG